VGVPVAGGTLNTAIQFNRAHAAVEMPFFNQDIFTLAQRWLREQILRNRSLAG